MEELYRKSEIFAEQTKNKAEIEAEQIRKEAEAEAQIKRQEFSEILNEAKRLAMTLNDQVQQEALAKIRALEANFFQNEPKSPQKRFDGFDEGYGKLSESS